MEHPTLASAKLDRYFHVCAFFNSRAEEYNVLGSFYREGVDWGEKALHIVDEDLIPDHKVRLGDCGIDVPACESCGQLQVVPPEVTYLKGGVFDQHQMLQAVDEVLAQGLKDGFPRTRIMGNMGWAFRGQPGSEDLIEYEARVNEVLARTRQPAICVYDTAKLSGAMMMDVLRAHPMTLVGGVVHENPFFTPPEKLLEEIKQRKARASSPAATA